MATNSKKIYLTQKGLDELKKELDDLNKITRPEVVRRLSSAREMGDLSENGYYKASRQQLTFLDSRIRRAERLVKLAVIVQSTNTGIIDIGSKVKIKDENKEYEYEIVGGYESDPSKHTISYISPIGRALMNKKKGDVIEVQIGRAHV